MKQNPLVAVVAVSATVTMMTAMPASSTTMINFETGYVDNQVLAPEPLQLLDSAGNASGVTIETVTGGATSIEASGDSDSDPDGFVTDTVVGKPKDDDSPSATSSLGDYFLRTTSAFSGDFASFNPVFTLNFLNGARMVSGEIWDIDGTSAANTEKWTVTAYNSMGGVLGTNVSPEFDNNGPMSLDGKEWVFSFSGNLISKIEVEFDGKKTSNIGVAFDNLEFAEVPLPATALLMFGGLGGLLAAARRRRNS